MKITPRVLKNLIREILEEQDVAAGGAPAEAPAAAPVKQRTDVAKVTKKMGATSGLGDLMQNIDNRVEFEGLLKQVVTGISKKIKPQDIFTGITNVLRDLKKDMKTK